MFNFLVMSGGWGERRDEFPLGRVYIADEQVQEWKINDLPNLDKMRTLPALFCEETERDGEAQYARVGEITHARTHDGNVMLEYRFDPDVPPIPHQQILALAPALGIRIPRRGLNPFNHTHWAIKDADLFKVLMTEWRAPNRQPQVFQLDTPQRVDRDLLSAMMPFAGFDNVWGAIQRAATANGMRFDRADNRMEHPAIIQDIVSLIDQSAIVVCDCSNSNANVFYEMGIAHALGKDVIIITQNARDISFDVAHLRHIRYFPNDEGLERLEEFLGAQIKVLRERAQ